jgi:RNA polymerase sigma-70 factor (ECF subfamily)
MQAQWTLSAFASSALERMTRDARCGTKATNDDLPGDSSRIRDRRLDVSDDQRLLEAITNRDATALEALYARYKGVTYALAQRILNDWQSAEEAVQDAFVAVWRRASTYRPEAGSVRTWVLAITRNSAIDRLRREKGPRSNLPLLDAVVPESSTARAMSIIADRDVMAKALDELPSDQRYAIELAYFGGYSYPEIATALDVPVGTIKSRIRLALEKMRASIQLEHA